MGEAMNDMYFSVRIEGIFYNICLVTRTPIMTVKGITFK